jgi:serine/threonine protein kinase
MSPEQALGATLDRRSDLFAAGLIFYELLTGKAPYKADTAIASLMKRTHERAIPPSDVDNSVPVSLSTIVSRCLEREPKDRYQSAGDLLRDLDAWIADPSRAASSSVISSAPPVTHAPSSAVGGPRSVQISLNLPSQRPSIWVAVAALAVLIFFAVPATRHLVFRPSAGSGTAGETVGIPDLSKGKYVAVLPLKILGNEKSLRYVADGLVEALSAKLFQLQSVQRGLHGSCGKGRLRQPSDDQDSARSWREPDPARNSPSLAGQITRHFQP